MAIFKDLINNNNQKKLDFIGNFKLYYTINQSTTAKVRR